MQAHIPPWAYPSKPVAWARFGRFSAKEANGPWKPEWAGRVPLWDSYTAKYAPSEKQRAESNLLIVRVLPGIEVVVKSSKLVSPDTLRKAVQKRLPSKKWPARRWYFSHLVYLSPKAVLNKRRGARIVRPCGSRIAVKANRQHLLAYIPLFDLPVSIKSEAGKHDWDIEFYLNRQPNHLPAWYAFLAGMGALERWERRLMFRAIAHLLPFEIEDLFKKAIQQVYAAGYTPSLPKTLAVNVSLLKEAAGHKEDYEYPCLCDLPSTLLCPDPRVILRITRMPASVVDLDNPKTETRESGSLQCSRIPSPEEFDVKGRPHDGAVKRPEATIVLLSFDKEKKLLKHEMPDL